MVVVVSIVPIYLSIVPIYLSTLPIYLSIFLAYHVSHPSIHPPIYLSHPIQHEGVDDKTFTSIFGAVISKAIAHFAPNAVVLQVS